MPGTSAQQLSDFNNQVLKGMTAGVLAAVISKSAVAPMDRVKLLLQLQSPSVQFAVQSQPYQGILDCFRRLCAEQGFRSLWRGNSATVLRCLPNQALNLAFRDRFRVLFLEGVDRRRRPMRFILGNVAAGGAGGALTLAVVYPLDFARTRLAVEGINRFRSIWHCFGQVAAQDGLTGLYRGFCASLLFTFASRAIFFGIFDSARLTLAEQQGQQLSFLTTWSLAQSSVVISSLLCYPLDTVRRRLMMEAGQPQKLYGTQLECWRAILCQEGPISLYKGALSNSLRCTSGALILAVYYEMLKHL